MTSNSILRAALSATVLVATVFAQTPAPSVRILLPERTRLLQGQLVALVLEVRNAASVANLKVTAGGVDLTSSSERPSKRTSIATPLPTGCCAPTCSPSIFPA